MDMPDAPNRKQEVATEWRKIQTALPGEAEADRFCCPMYADLMSSTWRDDEDDFRLKT